MKQIYQKAKAKSEAQGLFWADLYTAGAFDAIRIIQNLIYRKLHGTDLLAFSAIDAFLPIH